MLIINQLKFKAGTSQQAAPPHFGVELADRSQQQGGDRLRGGAPEGFRGPTAWPRGEEARQHGRHRGFRGPTAWLRREEARQRGRHRGFRGPTAWPRRERARQRGRHRLQGPPTACVADLKARRQRAWPTIKARQLRGRRAAAHVTTVTERARQGGAFQLGSERAGRSCDDGDGAHRAGLRTELTATRTTRRARRRRRSHRFCF